MNKVKSKSRSKGSNKVAIAIAKAKNPNLPYEKLLSLQDSKHPEIYRALALNPSIPAKKSLILSNKYLNSRKSKIFFSVNQPVVRVAEKFYDQLLRTNKFDVNQKKLMQMRLTKIKDDYRMALSDLIYTQIRTRKLIGTNFYLDVSQVNSILENSNFFNKQKSHISKFSILLLMQMLKTSTSHINFTSLNIQANRIHLEKFNRVYHLNKLGVNFEDILEIDEQFLIHALVIVLVNPNFKFSNHYLRNLSNAYSVVKEEFERREQISQKNKRLRLLKVSQEALVYEKNREYFIRTGKLKITEDGFGGLVRDGSPSNNSRYNKGG